MPPESPHDRKITTMTNSTDQTISPPLRRIREEGSTAAVTHYIGTRWPGIGGPELAPLQERAFLDPEFADAYQPGRLCLCCRFR
jgi:hypothetical protein